MNGKKNFYIIFLQMAVYRIGGFCLAFKVFQSVVSRIHDSIGIDFGVTDNTGAIIASAREEEIGEIQDQCSDFLLEAMYQRCQKN